MVGRVICTCPVVYRYILICTHNFSWCPFPKRYKQVGKTCLTLKVRPPRRMKSLFRLICTPFSLKQNVHLSITLYLNYFFDRTEDGRTKNRKKLPVALLATCSLPLLCVSALSLLVCLAFRTYSLSLPPIPPP